ncbi:alkaline phosphatase family protein [Thalassotalea sediminis]|uniref:alkaline phosphatase family protein n=1 Tax=Thalassotalea sediminis TaxID=1759089 RepID=UPI0025726FE8|nr:ectonucleotide pyrophosphatase/phosphodiesterase [Thalassotalea sediminis]
MFKSLLLLLAITLPVAAQNKNPVILLSIDGFAGDYLTQYKPPFLLKAANQGSYTKALLPVFPSKTFPNHLSMVTGKYPNQHGIVHNSFYHRDIKKNYTLGAGKHNSQWLTAKPIWTLAEQKGLISGVYFWPESETRVDGVLPTYVKPYKHDTENKKRLDQLISWLQLPKGERPQLLISYISMLDEIGHKYGTHSEKTKHTILKIDALIETFVSDIKRKTKLTPNIILVSDHGMINIDQGKKLLQSDLIGEGHPEIKVVNGQTQLFVYSDNATALNQMVTTLKNNKNHHHYQIYLAKDFPKHWYFDQHSAATPDLVVEAIPPAIFLKPSKKYPLATHGYDPKNRKALNAMLIAFGPDIKKGQEIAHLDNRYVFNLIATLLNLENDYDNDAFLQLLIN